MDLNELWVGDLVFIESLDDNASWEGLIDKDLALVKYRGETIKVAIQEISEAKLAKSSASKLKALEDDLKHNRATNAQKVTDFSEKKIDLHIEILNPSMQNQTPQMILNHQLMRARVFIDEAIENKRLMITVIQGNGEGVLKAKIKMMLAKLPEVDKIHEINNGGALEVWLKY